MRYRFIDAEKALYPIWLMCRVLEVAGAATTRGATGV